MSCGMVLEGTQDYLRELCGWDYTLCGIQPEGIPPSIAGQSYVAIEDGGVETGPENTHALTEIFNLEIGCWRRPGQFPKDRWREQLKTKNVYLPEVATLDTLERQVITTLHQNWKLWSYINSKFKLPTTGLGDNFTGQLVYRGRTKTEALSLSTDEGGGNFIGRRLRFRGLRRVQKITEMG